MSQAIIAHRSAILLADMMSAVSPDLGKEGHKRALDRATRGDLNDL